MDITLEKIELVKDRTGVTYKEAKDALEEADGNVVDAIIAIEETVDGGATHNAGAKKDALIAKMKEIAKKGNVSKIVISRNGEIILNIPLTVGILGTVVAPWGMIAGVVAAFGFKCKIEFIKDDGSTVDITEKADDLYEGAKEKGTGIYTDLKEKAPEVVSDLKEKSEDALSKVKDAAANAKDKIKGEEKDYFDIDFSDLKEEMEPTFSEGGDDLDVDKKPEEKTEAPETPEPEAKPEAEEEKTEA